MTERTKGERSAPGFVVFRQVSPDQWQLIGEVERRPGLTARAARAEAVKDAMGGRATPKDVYAAVLRSEWRIGLELSL